MGTSLVTHLRQLAHSAVQSHRLTRLAVLAFAVCCVHNSSAHPSYDAVVDLNAGCVSDEHGYECGDNPCMLIQHAINPWLRPEESGDARGGIDPIRSVRIYGDATIDYNDLAELEYQHCDTATPDQCTRTGVGSTPYRVCFALVGAGLGDAYPNGGPTFNLATDQHPIADDSLSTLPSGATFHAAKLYLAWSRLDLFFDGAVLTYEADSSQTTPVVIYQQGPGWIGGLASPGSGEWLLGVLGGVYERGHLSIFIKGDRDETLAAIKDTNGHWPAGVTPSLSAASFLDAEHSSVAIFTSGLTHSDASALRVRLAADGNDQDNIGLLHQHSWGVRRSGWRITGFGTGMVFYGNSRGTIENFYLSGNDVDFSGGDRTNGADVVVFDECLGSCDTYARPLSGLSIRDSVLEGAPYGIMNWFEGGSENLLQHLSMETHEPNAHYFLYGAGSCDDGQTCADHDECAGDCNFPATQGYWTTSKDYCDTVGQEDKCDATNACTTSGDPCKSNDDCDGTCVESHSWKELRIIGGELPADSSADGPWYGTVFGRGANVAGTVFLQTKANRNLVDPLDVGPDWCQNTAYPFVVKGAQLWLDVSQMTLSDHPRGDGGCSGYPPYPRIVDSHAHEIEFFLEGTSPLGYVSLHRATTTPTTTLSTSVVALLPRQAGDIARDWWLHMVTASASSSSAGATCMIIPVFKKSYDDPDRTSPSTGLMHNVLEEEVMLGYRAADDETFFSSFIVPQLCPDIAGHGRYYFLPLRYDIDGP